MSRWAGLLCFLHYSIIWLFSDSLPHLTNLGARVPCGVNGLNVESILMQFSGAGIIMRGDCVWQWGTSYDCHTQSGETTLFAIDGLGD